MPVTASGFQPTKEWITPVGQKSVDVALMAVPNAMGARELMAATLKGAGIAALQPTRLVLVLHVIIGKASPADKATIWVSLENTQIAPGPMVHNEKDHRGWYQDRIDVEMWIEEPDGSRSARFTRISDGPQTANGSSSTSSSVSFSFSSSANIGFFGGTPTGGAGVGSGITEGHSFSRNLTDFRVENASDYTTARHAYIMSATSGGPYQAATDLVPKDLGLFEAMKGIKLYDPPALATANLEIISQAVWQATTTEEIADKLYIGLKVRQRVANVDGTNNVVSTNGNSAVLTVGYDHREPLPMADIVDDVTGTVTLPLKG